MYVHVQAQHSSQNNLIPKDRLQTTLSPEGKGLSDFLVECTIY